MINGSDLTIEKKGKVRDLEIPLDKAVIKTDLPPLSWFLNQGAKKLSNENEPFYTRSQDQSCAKNPRHHQRAWTEHLRRPSSAGEVTVFGFSSRHMKTPPW